MPGYLVIHSTRHNDAWIEEYTRNVHPMISARGGRYLLTSQSVEVLEGEGHLPRSITVIEFPTLNDAKEFLAAPEYQPFSKLRRNNVSAVIFGVEAK